MQTTTFSKLNDFFNFLCLVIIIASADILLAVKMNMFFDILHLIIFAGFMIYYFLLRRFIHNLILFSLAHILPFVLILNLSMPMDFFAKLIFFAIGCSLADFKFWFDENKNPVTEISPLLIIIVLFAYLFTYVPDSKATMYLFIYTLIFLIACLLKTFFSNAHLLLHSGQLKPSMPIYEIFRNSTILVSIQCFFAILIMLFFKTDNIASAVSNFLNTTWNYITLFMRKLLEKASIKQVKNNEPLVSHAPSPIYDYGEAGQSNPILEKIGSIFLVLATLTIIAVIIISIITTIIKNIKKNLSPEIGINLKTSNEVRENLEHKKIPSTMPLWGQSNSEKIRKLYLKKLMSLKKKGASVYNTNTPKENANIIINNIGEDISKSTDLYEKIRYTPDYVASQNDVDTFKQLLKNK